MKQKFICMTAAFAMLMWAYVPVRAEFGGTLPKDQDWMMEITSSSNSDISVTVYYVGNNLDVIDVLTVPTGAVVVKTLPKPGGRTKRIVVEVDAGPGGRGAFRVNQSAPFQPDQASYRVVFNVV